MKQLLFVVLFWTGCQSAATAQSHFHTQKLDSLLLADSLAAKVFSQKDTFDPAAFWQQYNERRIAEREGSALGNLAEWVFTHLGFKVVVVGLLWLFWALSALFRRLKEAAKRRLEGEPDVFDEYRPKLPKGWE